MPRHVQISSTHKSSSNVKNNTDFILTMNSVGDVSVIEEMNPEVEHENMNVQ